MCSEYLYWLDYFRSKQFEKKFNHLKQLLKNKRVIFYCNGVYFDALSEVYNLSKIFNVVGVSDLRYEEDNNIYYKAFRCIKPSELSLENVDCIVITSDKSSNIKSFLKNNKLLPKRTNLILLDEVQENLFDKIKDIIQDKKYLLKQILHVFPFKNM